MKIEDHLRNINESFEVIKESIQRGISERQRSIGFHASAASIEMLEVFLHKENLINPGSMIKHDWFTSMRRVNERLNFDFPNKNEIVNIILSIESKRNLLCYGKKQPESIISEVLNSFNKIKSLFESLGVKWN
ncbi:hypothetical protein COU61_01405 [Candidatus Pacearchaeota archaeon CG10_big_fil_rev_8_21_14_0_10_35_13]|nr:MAG: hypothetical protein COU61_01405 [Candidatus Pacearchaeota archaeon CG10_big_fil_rev_8_21_14_0_10_35_13]